MSGHGNHGEKQISSIDIINKYGFSRATLNNYIKMKILPHPIVKRPDADTKSKAKQIGYFPYSALDTLEKVIQYKKEGRRMIEICKLFAEKPIRSFEGIQHAEPDKETGKMVFQRGVSDYGIDSEELFSFNETHAGYVSDAMTQKDIRVLLRQGTPLLLHFSVIVANIQNTSKLCAELPPDEYIGLIGRIWRSMTFLFKKYFGIYGKHPGSGIVFYFLKERDSSYLMNTVVCALELREMMKKMSHEWKINKRYLDDLYLNIGIDEGHEYLGAIPAAPAVEYISMGGSAHSARLLSDLARSGSVWTTKNFINHLDEMERRRIRYGIYRNEQNRDLLVDNIFSRVMDLVPQNDPEYQKFSDILILPVTEIHSLR